MRLRLLDLAGGVYPQMEGGMLRREERGARLGRMTLFVSSLPLDDHRWRTYK